MNLNAMLRRYMYSFCSQSQVLFPFSSEDSKPSFPGNNDAGEIHMFSKTYGGSSYPSHFVEGKKQRQLV